MGIESGVFAEIVFAEVVLTSMGTGLTLAAGGRIPYIGNHPRKKNSKKFRESVSSRECFLPLIFLLDLRN